MEFLYTGCVIGVDAGVTLTLSQTERGVSLLQKVCCLRSTDPLQRQF